MRGLRVVAGIAAVLSVLLLQACVIGPASLPVPVSLAAVLVAAVGLVDGPAAGMSLGFVCGLVADLGSDHPAGVLALCWLGIGLVAGVAAQRRGRLGDALFVGALCGGAAGVATLILAVAGHTDSWTDVRWALPAAAADAALALVVVPLTRWMLRNPALRPLPARPSTNGPAPRPEPVHLDAGSTRG